MLENLGYILPISLYPHDWKIEKAPLKLYPSEKEKLLFQSYKQNVYKATINREKPIFNEMIVSSDVYFRLTGKGRYINALK